MSANLSTRSQDQDPAFNARLDANERYAGVTGKERHGVGQSSTQEKGKPMMQDTPFSRRIL